MIAVPQTRVSFEDKVEHVIGDPTRPLRGHPPLEGEGDVGAGETA
ncbi:hypothetical protein X742_28675 [Mesorhizobium sp. LNHC232B00]|nr:hypothetical protein X742_28675 [Mesorhizobium sp. LNHC232B00]